MATKKLQILNSIIKQAENANTLGGKHADEFASASDVEMLKTQVGDTSVPEQIAAAIFNTVGRPTEEGGEVFGDYENNIATGEFSAAFGNKTTATGKSSMAQGTTIWKSGAEYIVEEESGKVYVISEDCEMAQDEPNHIVISKEELENLVGYEVIEHSTGAFLPASAQLTTVALGTGAFASGMGAAAYSRASKSLGYRTQTGYPASEEAVQNESHIILDTEGNPIYKAENVGQAAVALGADTKALGNQAVAAGHRSKAIGNNSMAIGASTQSLKDASFAAGSATIADGAASAVFGGGSTASGQASFASGSNTMSSGNSTHTEGISTKATIEAAHAEGYGTEATGKHSHAEGQNTKATKDDAHAEGRSTVAEGIASHAEGHETYAAGDFTHVEGQYTKAIGGASHAEGHATIAYGGYQHVQGKYNIEDKKSQYAHIVGNGNGDDFRSNAHTIDWDGNAWFAGDVEGNGHKLSEKANSADIEENYTTKKYVELNYTSREVFDTQLNTILTNFASKEYVNKSYTIAGQKTNTTLGQQATAEGYFVTASGQYSHAEGNSTSALGKWSHAEGGNTTAGGQSEGAEGGAHAEGYGTKALFQGSHAEGRYTTANGSGAHAEGYKTYAFHHAHAEGWESRAEGSQSHAEGTGTVARGENQHAQGKYNIVDTNKKYAHIVGNGDSDSVIYNNASEEISHDTYAYIKKLGTNLELNPNYTYNVIINDKTYTNLVPKFSGSGLAIDNQEGSNGYYLGESSVAENNGAWIEIPFTISSVGLFLAMDFFEEPTNPTTVSLKITRNSYRSNAHTVDWSGNAWFQGDIKIGGTGYDDANASRIATEAYVNNALGDLESALAELHAYAESLTGGAQ